MSNTPLPNFEIPLDILAFVTGDPQPIDGISKYDIEHYNVYEAKKNAPCMKDADGDGFGNPNLPQESCTQPSGYVANNTDFDDANATIYPNAPELCDGMDNNGNGTIDENPTDCAPGFVCENGSCIAGTTYYRDQDADGYGDFSNTILAGSTAPIGYVADNADCDDTDATTYPGSPEDTSDGIDNNCNGDVDECNGVLTTTECDCTDGIDNDADGDTDAADSDC